MSDVVKDAAMPGGLIGRSNVTVKLTWPLLASDSGIGPMVLLTIRGPAAMTIGWNMADRALPAAAPLTIVASSKLPAQSG